MRLAKSDHISRRWRIHELVYDFRLEDVWHLPGTGRPEHKARGLAPSNGLSAA
jgi:hypothetical protein